MAGFINCFPLVFYVYLTKLHRNVYILSTVGVIFVGRLVCSVNVLYMELSYTGSLDQSTRASEHVTVQISIHVRLPGWHVFIIIWNGYVLFFMHVVFVGRLDCSVNMLYMELSYTGSLDRSTRASVDPLFFCFKIVHFPFQIFTNSVSPPEF